MTRKIVYTINEALIKSQYAGTYTGYGITVSERGTPGERVLRHIEDFSLDRLIVEKLAESMNEGGLEPVHMDDVLYDALAAGTF